MPPDTDCKIHRRGFYAPDFAAYGIRHQFNPECVRLKHSRLRDPQLLIVTGTRDSFPLATSPDENGFHGMPCTEIQRPIIDDLGLNTLAFHRIDLTQPTQVNTRAIVGSPRQHLQCSRLSVLLVTSPSTPPPKLYALLTSPTSAAPTHA